MNQLPAYERELALAYAGNDPQRADRYLRLLLSYFDDFRITVGDARRAHEWEVARRSAHHMAGAAMYCAATALIAKTRELEEALKDERLKDADALFEDLEKEMHRLEDMAQDII